jgi:hypothetical protein
MKKRHPRPLQPITRQTANLATLRLSSLTKAPRLSWDDKIELSNLKYVEDVREKYREQGWRWGRGPEYLFARLIEALDLLAYEKLLLRDAKKPGRRKNIQLASLIIWEHAHGKTAKQIQETLANEGIKLTREAVESYLKTRYQTRDF